MTFRKIPIHPPRIKEALNKNFEDVQDFIDYGEPNSLVISTSEWSDLLTAITDDTDNHTSYIWRGVTTSNMFIDDLVAVEESLDRNIVILIDPASDPGFSNFNSNIFRYLTDGLYTPSKIKFKIFNCLFAVQGDTVQSLDIVVNFELYYCLFTPPLDNTLAQHTYTINQFDSTNRIVSSLLGYYSSNGQTDIQSIGHTLQLGLTLIDCDINSFLVTSTNPPFGSIKRSNCRLLSNDFAGFVSFTGDVFLSELNYANSLKGIPVNNLDDAVTAAAQGAILLLRETVAITSISEQTLNLINSKSLIVNIEGSFYKGQTITLNCSTDSNARTSLSRINFLSDYTEEIRIEGYATIGERSVTSSVNIDPVYTNKRIRITETEGLELTRGVKFVGCSFYGDQVDKIIFNSYTSAIPAIRIIFERCFNFGTKLFSRNSETNTNPQSFIRFWNCTYSSSHYIDYSDLLMDSAPLSNLLLFHNLNHGNKIDSEFALAVSNSDDLTISQLSAYVNPLSKIKLTDSGDVRFILMKGPLVEFSAFDTVVLSAQSLINQEPAGEGPANTITVTFGAAQDSDDNVFSLGADGVVTINSTFHTPYRFAATFRVGRTSATGVKELLYWYESSVDGGTVWTPVDTPVVLELDDETSTVREAANVTLRDVPVGVKFRVRFARGVGGPDNGGLYFFDPTADFPDLSISPSAEITVTRLAF